MGFDEALKTSRVSEFSRTGSALRGVLVSVSRREDDCKSPALRTSATASCDEASNAWAEIALTGSLHVTKLFHGENPLPPRPAPALRRSGGRVPRLFLRMVAVCGTEM